MQVIPDDAGRGARDSDPSAVDTWCRFPSLLLAAAGGVRPSPIQSLS